MKQLAFTALVVSFANVAHADTPAKKDPAPDEIADVESREANLESKAPRKGLTFAGAVGGSLKIGDGAGRGPSLSLRLGHVATHKTIITFELTGSSALHKRSGAGPGAMEETLADSNFGLFAGAQRYTTGSLWVRAAGGVTLLVKNANTDGTGGEDARGGIGGLVGAGFDVARWGYLVLGFETFGMGSVSGDGVKVQLSFGLGSRTTNNRA